jgi:methylmalonyl-CoA epimerase
MKVEKIDHVHVYVKDLERAKNFFEDIFGTKFSEPIIAEPFQVKSRIDPLGLELLEATSPESPIARHIEKRGEGIVAIAVKVPDIEAAIQELEAKGLRLVGRIQLGGIKEAQFHPKDTYGMMVELCEYQEVHGAALACFQEEKK